jgi:hypothetical protein
VPCRLTALGAVVVSLAAGLAYVNGWLTPTGPTSSRIINAFEANVGPIQDIAATTLRHHHEYNRFLPVSLS